MITRQLLVALALLFLVSCAAILIESIEIGTLERRTDRLQQAETAQVNLDRSVVDNLKAKQ